MWPHPARAFAGIPMHFCRPPPPRSRLRQGIPGYLAGPPTPPAPSALLPRPLPGRGPCVVISGGAAVPGSSPGSPHVLDRGDIATGGWRLAGRGNSFPLPCLSRSQDPAHLTDSTRISAGRLPCTSAGPPPPVKAGNSTRAPVKPPAIANRHNRYDGASSRGAGKEGAGPPLRASLWCSGHRRPWSDRLPPPPGAPGQTP